MKTKVVIAKKYKKIWTNFKTCDTSRDDKMVLKIKVIACSSPSHNRKEFQLTGTFKTTISIYELGQFVNKVKGQSIIVIQDNSEFKISEHVLT